MINYTHESNIVEKGDEMKYREQILRYLKENHGVVTTSWCKNNAIPSIYLHRMEQDGTLTKVGRGIYIDETGDYDEFYFFQLTHTKCIYSYLSALYLQGRTDQIPQSLDVTVYKGYNPHRLPNRVTVHYVNREIYELGITDVKTNFGNIVRAYDMERTLCDLIYNREKVSSELFAQTVKMYGKSADKRMMVLFNYAEKMGITEDVQRLMEVYYE